MASALFLIEHRAREFDAACAIRHHLRDRHGEDMRIVDVASFHKSTWKGDNPLVVALPYGRSAETWWGLGNIVRRLPTASFVDMCWEQFVSTHASQVRAPTGRFAKEHLYHHSWGKFHTDYLLHHSISRERIFENGHPGFALYGSRYESLSASRTELAHRHGLDPQKPWILFAENYAWAFYEPGDIKDRFLNSGLDPETAGRYRRFNVESLAKALDWLSRLDLDVEVILRPRPAVSIDAYRAAFNVAGLNPGRSVSIIKDGPVRDWIHACDAVTSSYSTTLLEAALAGKPAFAIEPVPFDAGLADTQWVKAIDRVTSFENFSQRLQNARFLPPADALATFARQHAHACDDALVGAADMLAHLLTKRRKVCPEPIRLDGAGATEAQSRDRAWRFIAMMKGAFLTRNSQKKPEVAFGTVPWSEPTSSDQVSEEEVEVRTRQVARLFD